MKWTSWGFLVCIGSLVFLVLFIADWEMNASGDRLSRIKLPPRSALDDDPSLKLVSERSLYRNHHR
jgi:hypothetical protein